MALRLSHNLVAVALLGALLLAGCRNDGQERVSMASGDPLAELRNAWFEMTTALQPGDFIALAGINDLPARLMLHSESWHKRILKPEANPHQQEEPATTSCYPAAAQPVDLLRFQFVSGERPIEILESAGFIIVRSPTTAGEPAEQFAKLAADTLNAELPAFVPIRTGEEVEAHSTSPVLPDHRMHEWSDRVDALEHDGQLMLLIYKKHIDYDDFVNLAQWFDLQFRADVRGRG